jgi:hypothetical protein
LPLFTENTRRVLLGNSNPSRLVLAISKINTVRLPRLQEPYDRRPIRFLELWRESGWTMKVYGIAYGRPRPREQLVEAAKAITLQELDDSAHEQNHYGVGFLSIHDGRDANFVFLDYWADENELHHHVFVSPSEEPASFEDVTVTGLIACAWDIRVLSFERDAWVEAVLANPFGPDPEGYLTRRLNEDA